MRERADEHGRDAVETGAAFGLHRLQHGARLEGVGRDHDGGPVRHRAEIAHHHAEAVIERNWNADAIRGAVAAAHPGEVRVVQDVPVREGRALRKPRGAARVLDVDRIVGRERGRARAQGLAVRGVSLRQQRVPLRRSEKDRLLQPPEPGAHLAHHRDVVRGLEARGRDQHAAARLVEGVLELARAVGRVDVDEDRAELRRGVLHQHPLDVVRAPDAHPVTGLEPASQQAPSEPVGLGVELRVGEPEPLVARHHRLLVGCTRRRPLESRPDRLVEQRRVDGAAVVRQGHRYGVYQMGEV